MSGVSVDSGGGGGKKSTNSEINMVPMIDLLVSCIAFLLMTAVWVQTGALQARQPAGQPQQDQPRDEPPQDQLKIQLSPTGFRVGLTAADMHDISNGPQRFDQLRANLDERHRANAQNKEVWLQPDGAVSYDDIIRVMDVVYGVWGSAAADNVTIRFL